ncbi:protein phosphatase 2C, putative [Trypanosoma equiperdum]|uniref:Protein phosphatase n=2 Tax=Trypanozoon TaxID=39700 RepID=Q57Z96_TRYB2|nr:protein phosphatase 2C, putative [Trypanosoma brucei brucei TREU927]AAX80254.1 protein phosphatase 2C, putative [Trypanosoma brucei]AAZ10250.1 protein phosphatase 2C, putative [Trypanosoma brucei brucei TREU927]SCU70657.1 protein phosphatase 2C, putative [Trypanosoma equiperdum]
MGGQSSVTTTPEQIPVNGKSLDWGPPPDDIPEEERDNEELVLQTWAFCKAKPSPAQNYRSDVEERKRRQSMLWRKRASFIELDCGEDSFFVSNTYKVIGVADGVGGWRDEGVDASHFANSLMENAKHFSETHRKELNPEVILQSAFDKVLHDKVVKAGSSTACVVALQKDSSGEHYLDVANVGDSGVLVVRNRQVQHRVHEKVHGFNAPFQLAVLPPHLQGRAFSDRVSDATREKIPVQRGDVVITGTDGLFDNRFNISLAADAGWIGHVQGSALERVPLVGLLLGPIFANDKVAYVDPQRVAQRIVQDAYKTSLDESAHTPWASMLRKFGVEDAKGGKVDDITLVLSRVTTREELNATSTW